MALLQVALIGGASYALIQASRRRRRRPKWLERTQIRTSEATSHFRATLSELDDRYQRLVQTKLDPLLGGQARQEQLDSLSAESKLKTNDLIPDAGDAELNRYLALAGAVMGVATVGQLLLPSLLPLALVGSLWLVWPVYVSGFQSIRRERRVKIEVLSALYLSGLILLGYYVFVGVVSALFFIGTKILFQTESRSREGLSHIFGEQPRFAWRIVDGVEVQTAVADLHAGDVIVV
ncbi:MAG: hypothetical protein KDE19_09445, partial [Caldilineaceae bacterium]|nr:hypothetical protein [Caldilineaceae bacterium]